jgi:capsular exopolysaccharide synthesis family protein
MIHKIFGLRNTWGVANVLVGEHDLQEIWQAPLPGLKVGVAGGPVPPDPAELLISEGFVELLNQVRLEFDYVLLDVPSTQRASDAVVVASQADGVLLVIDSEGTQKRSIRGSMRSLETVGASVLGMVINNATTSADGY